MIKIVPVLFIMLLLIGAILLISLTSLHSTVKNSPEHSAQVKNHGHAIIKKQQKFSDDESKPAFSPFSAMKEPAASPRHSHNKKMPRSDFRFKDDDAVTVNPSDPMLAHRSSSSSNNNNNKLFENPVSSSREEDWFPDPIESIFIEARKDRWSEPSLLKNYERNRAHKACDILPSNITFEEDSSVVLGEVSVARMPKWRRDQLRAATSSASSYSVKKCSHAFVLMVSNHKYVDGALVMAETLWKTSKKLREGTICLVMLTSEKLHPNSIRQLSLLFDVVKALRTLGTFVPKSYYAPTFDKAYLWSLTEYRHVMFLDADHYVSDASMLENLLISGGGTMRSGAGVAVSSKRQNQHHESNDHDHDSNSNNNKHTDDENNSDVPENRIVAVGDHSYFQTGLMILKPNMNVFVDLYLEFRYGKFGYNQWRARDGILIRNCFLKSNEGISHPSGIFHFYGYFKPWFDFRKSRKITKEPIDFANMYLKWWATYEELHLQLFRYMPYDGLYGGKKARKLFLQQQVKRKFTCKENPSVVDGDDQVVDPNFVDPDCFMWLQRHREAEEYIQPLSSVKYRWWDIGVSSLKILSSHPHQHQMKIASSSSCNAICKEEQLVCRDDAFQWSILSDCGAFNTLVSRRMNLDESQTKKIKCSYKTDGTNLPYYDESRRSNESFIHSFLAQKFQPRCDAGILSDRQTEMMIKFCPCVSKHEQNKTASRPNRLLPKVV